MAVLTFGTMTKVCFQKGSLDSLSDSLNPVPGFDWLKVISSFQNHAQGLKPTLIFLGIHNRRWIRNPIQ